jgi:hypothetical protein
MIWVIGAITAVGFALFAIWIVTRRRPEPSIAVDAALPRLDPVRAGLVTLAAAIALLAGVDAFADRTIEFPPISALLLAAAVAALMVALPPTRGIWSDNRRLAAALLASAWVAIGLATLPFAVMVSACGCAAPGPGYVPPAPLGLETRSWIMLAVAGGPTLLLLASSRLPDRIYARVAI